MDVVFVGAGPANLSGALHLARLVKQYNDACAKGDQKGEPLGEIEIGVIEKGSSVGAHILSGAVMDPRALKELIPDFVEQGAPLESPVKEDYFLYLTEKRAIRSPITPPPLKNHGYYIVSLNRLTAWLGEKCEEAGVNIFPERCSTVRTITLLAFEPVIRESIGKANGNQTSNLASTCWQR
jgi:electron-transferring-flavoprotein dehydrogenase